MKTLILSHAAVEELLPMAECIEVMEEALRSLGRGEVHNPLRQKIAAPGAPGILGLMPAWRGGDPAYYALKEVCVFPGNPARGLDSHVGTVILHSGDTGEPLAILSASAITAIRTAAVSAVATRLLARPDAQVLAILGTGVQSKTHEVAIPLVRPIREIRTYSRSGGTASSAEECVRGADVVVTATSSREPVLRREWLSPGVHINAVGSSIPAARELDGETVAACSLFVDRRESTIHESGDYLFALQEGAIDGPGHIRAELGELLLGSAEGRNSPDELTLFKSLGLGVEDLAAAAYLYEKVRNRPDAVWVEL
jgi:ornithine cyclodeaminase/alanine dehydrogenase-like protein (mu-crystallin family)